ncbi:hypothetical protein NKJ23_16190 [Mesorhizobium sp. M0184]|uniref:hypothetical protein n=1 Tax=Mesorhizobium sp. M0184 TaxID=2956906 RepID=UPI0033373251
MPKLGYGILANGNPALRIALDNGTDLRAEPSSNVGKFQFDSENTKLSHIEYMITELHITYGGSGWNGMSVWFFNPGDFHWTTPITTNPGGVMGNTCGGQIYNEGEVGNWSKHLFKEFWDFGYMPLVEYKQLEAGTTDTFKGPLLDKTLGNYSGKIVSMNGKIANWTVGFRNVNWNDYRRECYRIFTSSGKSYVETVWRLPIRDVPLTDYSTTPVSGQQVLLLSPTTARLALPGRDVSDTDPNHYIFHEDKIPAKIMAAGDVNIALGGTVTINTPLPLSILTSMDFHVKRQADAEFWNPPYFIGTGEDQELGFTYKVQAQSILITNLAESAITVRYVIHASDDQAHTTGGKKVLLKGNDGVQDFIQIKRPGSSDLAPGLNDIIIDTRLAYMPIIAEGWLVWPTDFPTVVASGARHKGERMATVSFANPDPKFKPYVKQIVVFPETNRVVSNSDNGMHQVFVDAGSWTGRCTARSSWANLHETSVDFYMAGSNPYDMDGGGTNPVYPDDPALGLRYYIFAIPNSL